MKRDTLPLQTGSEIHELSDPCDDTCGHFVTICFVTDGALPLQELNGSFESKADTRALDVER